MAVEDYLEPEVGVAVAVSAVVFSPPVRRVVRRGMVYGLAGIMMAGDALGSLARGIGRGVQGAATTVAEGTGAEAPAAPPPAGRDTPAGASDEGSGGTGSTGAAKGAKETTRHA